jgi:hypothetical protein
MASSTLSTHKGVMPSNPLAIAAVLCALIVFPQLASADCLSAIWSARQSRADGPQSIRSLQTVDFDGDGKLDLVGLIDTTNVSESGVLSVWRGLGDGTFAPPVSLGTAELVDLKVVDVNNDGFQDLIMTNAHGVLLVRLGNGSGFDAPIIQSLGYFANQLVAVHLNGHLFADLITLGVGNGIIGVYHGDGHGNFSESTRLSATPYPYGIAAADFDGDGLTDIAYGVDYPDGTSSVNIYFQRAGGTFDPPLVLPAPYRPEALAVGDLNEDGRPDLVGVFNSANFANDPAVAIFRNLGSRNFSRSDLGLGLSLTVGNLSSVSLADVNGDGHLDIVTGAWNGGYVVTYAGKGDGTFRSPTFLATDSSQVDSVVLGDFDGDHVLDLAAGEYQRFFVAKSTCGTQVFLYTVSPVITQGQSASLGALVSGLTPATPLSRGTVTFYEGMTTLGSTAVDGTGLAQLDVGGLSLGNHTLTASFSGNSEAVAGTSQSIVQQVITGATTTTLTLPQGQFVYGTPYTFSVDIRSQYGTQINACWFLNLDGAKTSRCGLNVTLNLSAGQHTLTAAYHGNVFNPPSTSGPHTITIAKATPAFTLTSGDLTVRAGQTHTLQFAVTGPTGAVPTGSVQILRGSTLLGSGAVSANAATVSMTFNRGEYDVAAVYSGANFNSATINLTLAVLPNAPLAIHARGLQNAISIRAVLPEGTTSVLLYRRTNGSGNSWQVVNGWSPASEFDNTALLRGVVYDYRLDAVSDVGQSSNIDSALLFTDDPLVPGTTVVKRVHFDEARLLVNVLRASAGLPPFSFDGTYPGPFIRASHLASLRTALTEARQVLGMDPPTFTDAATPGTRIKAVHLVEIRQQAQ